MTNIGLISESDNSTVLAEYKVLDKTESTYQSESQLENELINILIEQGYERIYINSEDELILNLRKQLEKLNNSFTSTFKPSANFEIAFKEIFLVPLSTSEI